MTITIPAGLLEPRILNSQVRELRGPASFLQDLLIPESQRQAQFDDLVQYSILRGDRKAAPFIAVNGEAQMVDGFDEDFREISYPNIRLKRVMEASNRMLRRMGTQPVFGTAADRVAAMRERILQDQQRLNDLIINRREWMVAMALRGSISYQVGTKANFTVSMNRLASHDANASVAWSTPATAVPNEDMLALCREVNKNSDLNCNFAIFSEEAATNLFKVDSLDKFLDRRRLEGVNLEFVTRFESTGARFLGSIGQLACWEYARQINVDGSLTSLIRPGYVELMHVGPEAEWRMDFGPIPDEDAVDEGLWVAQNYTKSWKEPDPSGRVLLQHSRPLPYVRRPESTSSLDTTP